MIRERKIERGKKYISAVLRISLIFPVLLLTGSLLFGGGQPETQGEKGAAEGEGSAPKPSVYVSILPQRYFLERVAGDLVDVKVLVPPGKSPATYEPTPTQVMRLGEADIFFTIGVPFERAFLPSIEESLKNLVIVPTHAPIDRRPIEAHTHEDEHGEDEHEGEEEEEHHDEEHEGEGHSEEDHAGEEAMPDPHIWMSPKLVKIQAREMKEALSEEFPEYSGSFEEGYSAFTEDLTELQEYLKKVLAPHRGETLFVYHPAFGYFAEEFGLHQVAIETGGKEPTPKQLEEVINHAREEGVKVIFVQPEFPLAGAEAVAKAIGGAVVPVAPLAPNYLENLRNLAQNIDEALTGK